MSIFVKTTDNYIAATMTTLLGAAPGYTYLTQFREFVEDNGSGTTGLYAYASALTNYTLAFYADNSFETLASSIAANIGITDATLAATAASNIQEFLESAGDNLGQAMIQLIDIIVGLQTDATWGAAAATFVNKANAAYVYSVNPANTSYDLETLREVVAVDDDGNVVNPGQTFTLTVGSDTADSSGSFRNGSNVEGDFKFTTGNELIVASSATLDAAGNADSLIDSSTSDNDVMNLAFTAGVLTSSIQNIETINVAASGAAGTLTLTGVSGLKTINVSGNPTGGVTLEATAGGNDIGDTGVTKIDASGLTSNAAVLTVSSAASTSTAGLTITGGAAADVITGGLGADTIVGGAGADRLNGGAGNDNISGGTGNDFIQGVNGNDTLKGEAGNDNIDGGLGNDTIEGGAGVDIIVTTGGNDKVTGGAGNDEIVLGTFGGGLAWNTAVAGVAGGVAAGAAAGVNTVVFEDTAANNGNDNIYFFTAGATTAAIGGDILDFSAFLGADVAFSDLVNVTDGNDDTLTDYNVIYLNDTFGNITDTVTYANNAKLVVIEDDGTDLIVNYVTTDANGNATATAVATLVGISGAALIEANFA